MNRLNRLVIAAGAVVIGSSALAACSSSGGKTNAGSGSLTKVKLQLQWFSQAH
ncbi:MAG: hypothetical protein JWR06_541, partial [Jatrophihabitans sp.]|nr:hypothetical protein [Jatrophihabitans sp.]